MTGVGEVLNSCQIGDAIVIDDDFVEAVVDIAEEDGPPEPGKKSLAACVKERLVLTLAGGPEKRFFAYFAARVAWAILKPILKAA